MLTWTPVISAYLKMLTPPTPWGLWSIVPFRPFSLVLMLAKLVFVKSESGTWLASNQWACDWLEGVVINHIQLHRPGLQVFVLPRIPRSELVRSRCVTRSTFQCRRSAWRERGKKGRRKVDGRRKNVSGEIEYRQRSTMTKGHNDKIFISATSTQAQQHRCNWKQNTWAALGKLNPSQGSDFLTKPLFREKQAVDQGPLFLL